VRSSLQRISLSLLRSRSPAQSTCAERSSTDELFGCLGRFATGLMRDLPADFTVTVPRGSAAPRKGAINTRARTSNSWLVA
jgi:hypothetical protein